MQLNVPTSPTPGEPDRKCLCVYESKQGVLFVRAEDLPWLLHYMYEETQGKGVPEPTDDNEESLDDARPWVTRWRPSGTRTVEMIGGPLAGRTWASRISDLTEEKWATGSSKLSLATPFCSSTRAQKKEVLLAYLEHVVAEAHSKGT